MATKGGFSKGWKGFVDHKWIKERSARARGWASLLARSPLGDTAGQSALHASGAVAFRYLMRTGIAASRSESCASLRIGHQSYKKISRGRHMETQPPIVRLSRTISPIDRKSVV